MAFELFKLRKLAGYEQVAQKQLLMNGKIEVPLLTGMPEKQVKWPAPGELVLKRKGEHDEVAGRRIKTEKTWGVENQAALISLVRKGIVQITPLPVSEGTAGRRKFDRANVVIGPKFVKAAIRLFANAVPHDSYVFRKN